jgi:hypothetical protein
MAGDPDGNDDLTFPFARPRNNTRNHDTFAKQQKRFRRQEHVRHMRTVKDLPKDSLFGKLFDDQDNNEGYGDMMKTFYMVILIMCVVAMIFGIIDVFLKLKDRVTNVKSEDNDEKTKQTEGLKNST